MTTAQSSRALNEVHHMGFFPYRLEVFFIRCDENTLLDDGESVICSVIKCDAMLLYERQYFFSATRFCLIPRKAPESGTSWQVADQPEEDISAPTNYLPQSTTTKVLQPGLNLL
jgi:hypothetical protein